MANFREHLPSKRFQRILLAILIIAGGVFLFGGRKKNKPETFVQKETLTEMFLGKEAIDSDGDGLKDWEEILWKTNPQNRDTDGDGTPDGEEIAGGRDPTKPWPNDKITSVVSPNGARGEAATTYTEDLSKRFFAEYLSLKKTGNLDQTAKDNLVSSFVDNLPAETGARVYKTPDIIINDDNSLPSLENYAEKLRSVIKKHSGPVVETDAQVIARLLKSEDDSVIPDLEKHINIYKNALADLKTIKVPSSLASLHLAFMNSLSDIKLILEDVGKSFKDPVLTLAAVKRYPGAGEDLVLNLRDIQDKLRGEGIDVSLDTL